jgi:hypothetical protein
LIFAVVVLLAGVRKLPFSLTIYGLLLVIVPALFGKPDSPMMGVPRYVLMAFPIFFVVGLLSKKQASFRHMADREHRPLNDSVRALRDLAVRRLEVRV